MVLAKALSKLVSIKQRHNRSYNSARMTWLRRGDHSGESSGIQKFKATYLLTYIPMTDRLTY